MGLCNICPRKCGLDRDKGKTGVCGQTNEIRLSRAALHYWEEPCISGKEGSGAVFFSGCPLRCVYCQNYGIAMGQVGKTVSLERLVDIYFELQEKGAGNINLVTPTHFVPQIVKSIETAKARGLRLPFVYNTSGYELVDTLRMLDGLIDIYLPDFKYMDEKLAKKYSNAPDYPMVATLAVDEMVRQTGKCKFYNDDEEGLMKKGTIVRHLMLPDCIDDSKNVIKHLYNRYNDDIYMSIMNQFTPLENVKRYPELDRRVTAEEYDELVDYAIEIGVENGFIQEGETARESFIPVFDCEGV